MNSFAERALPGLFRAAGRRVTVAVDGTNEAPKRAGLGFDVDLGLIDERTETLERITPRDL